MINLCFGGDSLEVPRVNNQKNPYQAYYFGIWRELLQKNSRNSYDGQAKRIPPGCKTPKGVNANCAMIDSRYVSIFVEDKSYKMPSKSAVCSGTQLICPRRRRVMHELCYTLVKWQYCGAKGSASR